MRVAIIDYQLSNLFSVKHALDYLKINSEITSDPQVVAISDAAIIPGVGAFADAMKNLKSLGLLPVINDFIQKGKPFMGVCLGMQLLLSQSEEFGLHQGLDVIKGTVKKFSHPTNLIKVPQIGWNQISSPKSWANTPLTGIKDKEYMYFVHSYYCTPFDKKVILATTNYESINYCSAILHKNTFATQFHPEKSGKTGIQIYKNWLKYSTQKL